MPKTRMAPSRVKKRSNRSIMIKNLNKARRVASLAVNNMELSGPAPSSTIPINEHSDNLPELEIEVDSTYKSIGQLLDGRRIVNLGYVLEEYEHIVRHRDKCTMGRMAFVRETRFGMNSYLHFYCDNCEKSKVICTDPDHKENSLSDAVVWGSLSIGIGKSQLEELFALMDVPFMTQKTYTRKTAHVKQIWEKQMYMNMQSAGREEAKNAIERGNIMPDGTPYITVIVDGGWSKRSYGHGYNAASGVGIIIGAHTKKPLFLGVKNKTCSACSFYSQKQIPAKPHNCAKNYSGPSTGMEQEIIVEGFCKSLEHHGLVYKYLIGDGDSSVYARIIEGVPYGRSVIKIECANHMTRCLSDKLHRLSKNTSFEITNRKILTKKDGGITNLERLVKSVRTIVKNNANDVVMLRKDLANAPHHVFGNHSNCRDTFCTRKSSNEEDLTKKMSQAFLVELLKIVEPMVNKADRLAFNETTNQAERYMALVAKCTGGKRVNFSKSISYTVRAYGAALSHHNGPSWHLSAWKGNLGRNTSRVLLRRKKAHDRRKGLPIRRVKNRISHSGRADFNYGPNAAQPDITEEEMATKKNRFLDDLKAKVASDEKLREIEKITRGQHDNQVWRELRQNYLTASNFGSVMRRRAITPCHNLVKSILYKKELNTSAVVYGRVHENKAIELYERTKGVHIIRCGLLIDPEHPFLAASPDGLIGNDGLIEVKCLQSVKGKLRDHDKPNCFSITENEISLKRNHNYFYQIQGQLNICRRNYCDFVLYADNDFHIERIERDDSLWNEKMVPKLTDFYMKCILPELIDARIPRGMKAREQN